MPLPFQAPCLSGFFNELLLLFSYSIGQLALADALVPTEPPSYLPSFWLIGVQAFDAFRDPKGHTQHLDGKIMVLVTWLDFAADLSLLPDPVRNVFAQSANFLVRIPTPASHFGTERRRTALKVPTN